jgi:hypothetical protein
MRYVMLSLTAVLLVALTTSDGYARSPHHRSSPHVVTVGHSRHHGGYHGRPYHHRYDHHRYGYRPGYHGYPHGCNRGYYPYPTYYRPYPGYGCSPYWGLHYYGRGFGISIGF